jgi:hypothetical protein
MKSFIKRDAKQICNSDPKLAVQLVAQSLERIGSHRARVCKQVCNSLKLSRNQVENYSTEALEGLLRNNSIAEEKLTKANRRFLAANARNKKVSNSADEFWAKLEKIAQSDSEAAEAARELLDEYGEGDWEDQDEMDDFSEDYNKFMSLNKECLQNERFNKMKNKKAQNCRSNNRRARNARGNFAGRGPVTNSSEDEVLRPLSTLDEEPKK